MRSVLLSLTVLALVDGADPAPAPHMSYLDNGVVRIGMDLDRGGAVTFLECHARPGNLINSYDLGRQIQMSQYSGPVPFTVPGHELKKEWTGIGWNPIQTGDVFHHPSRVLDQKNDGTELYVKCVPMQWPLDDVPGECTYETWTTLDGPVINMRFRMVNHRGDTTQYPARQQELPAVYTIAALHRWMTYTGERPFAGEALTHVENDWRKPWPWTHALPTERWSALVGDDDWGLGVFSEDGGHFDGGLYGAPGSRDPLAGATAYLAPVQIETIDHDIVYAFRATLMVGTLTEIRARFNALATRSLPTWTFAADRQHWHVEGGVDAGPPHDGAWRIPCGAKPPRLMGPTRCWRAEDGRAVTLTATCTQRGMTLHVHWRRLGQDDWQHAPGVAIALTGDGQPHDYRAELGGDGYQGLLTGLSIVPEGGGDALLSLHRIAIVAER